MGEYHEKWVKELPHRVPLRDGVEWSWSFLTGEGRGPVRLSQGHS